MRLPIDNTPTLLLYPHFPISVGPPAPNARLRLKVIKRPSGDAACSWPVGHENHATTLVKTRLIVYAFLVMSREKTPVSIETTPPGSRHAALRMLHLGDTVISRLLAAERIGEIEMLGLFHARRTGGVVGAAWGQVVPGRSAFCWPACIAADEPEKTAYLLQNAVDEHLDSAGIALTQAILSARDITNALRLAQAGYQHLADLDYLVSSIEQFPVQPPGGELTFRAMVPMNESRMHVLIERTYQGTLDCTGIDGVRGIDDVLTGYRRTGVYRPEWWTIAQYQGHDVGCVLLADHPDNDQCELMYLGIVPEMRGRRWGELLTCHAQWTARCAARQRIVLAVDDTNVPARNLYERAGFSRWDRRSVYVRTAYSNGSCSPSTNR